MQPRFQFPLYKLFLVMAAYAAALGWFSQFGTDGRVFSVFFGTTFSAIIMLMRRRDVLPMCIVGAATLIAFVGSALLIAALQHIGGDIAGLFVWVFFLGTITSGFVGASFVRKRQHNVEQSKRANPTASEYPHAM